MKKSFTLIEVIISISIFMILVVFLYKTLEQTKYSNEALSKKEIQLKYLNRIYDVIYEDLNESYGNISIDLDTHRNSIVRFSSLNSFHNSFFQNITYLINSKNTLVRMESKNIFKVQANPFTFYNDIYIDEILSDIEYFEVQKSLDKKQESYIFIIKQKNKKREIFSIIKPFNIEIKLNKTQKTVSEGNKND
jgi:type II secretory pathway pseudopilin PulG